MIPLEILEQAYEQANRMLVPRDHPYIRMHVLIPEKTARGVYDPFRSAQYCEIEFKGPKPFIMKAIQQELPFKEQLTIWDFV